MTSGQMWNHIRGPPFMHKNPQTGQAVSRNSLLRCKLDKEQNSVNGLCDFKLFNFVIVNLGLSLFMNLKLPL